MADYSTLLRDHVTLTCRSIDRIFLQAYVPKLQTRRLGVSVPALAAGVHDPVVGGVRQDRRRLRRPRCTGGPRRMGSRSSTSPRGTYKEEIARPLIEAAAAEGGDGRVVLIGIAQEKAPVWRSWKAKGQEHAAHPHMEWGRQMAFVNHFYFYLWDPEWGGAFWKTNAYAPYPIWIWLNGHEWAKRQCEKAGIGYTALDNGFRDCERPGSAAEDLRPARLGRGEELLLALAAPAALPVHPRRSARRLRLRAGVSPVRGLRHPGVRPARGRAGVLRAGHPRPPRRRPTLVGGVDLRPAGQRAPRAPSAPRSSPAGSTRSCAATTSPAGSSSTSRSTERCAPRPSSATPATSASAGGSTPRTGMPSGRLASTPTSVCVTPKPPTPDPLPTWPPSPR